jgi:hypothetical protein
MKNAIKIFDISKMLSKFVIFQKIFANSDNSDLLGNFFIFKGKANLRIKM